jgi:hypothetical protein
MKKSVVLQVAGPRRGGPSHTSGFDTFVPLFSRIYGTFAFRWRGCTRIASF